MAGKKKKPEASAGDLTNARTRAGVNKYQTSLSFAGSYGWSATHLSTMLQMEVKKAEYKAEHKRLHRSIETLVEQATARLMSRGVVLKIGKLEKEGDPVEWVQRIKKLHRAFQDRRLEKEEISSLLSLLYWINPKTGRMSRAREFNVSNKPTIMGITHSIAIRKILDRLAKEDKGHEVS